MGEVLGLRERKKQRTHDAISEVAIALFLERGFDKVSIAEIAAEAEVSKMTVFNHFPTKEDLVLHRFADHFEDTAEIVRGRAPGQSPLGALRAQFLAALDARHPTSGLCDDEQVLRFQQMVLATPSLWLRMQDQQTGSEEALVELLTEELGAAAEDVTPRIVAGQLLAVQNALVLRNVRRMIAGERAEDVYPEAVAAANRAFDLLADGLTTVFEGA